MSQNRPQVFIEKIFPIKILNEQTYFENGGNPFKGLHRWYSRKPLSFSRASVLGSILPADITLEEFLYLLGLFSEAEMEYLDLKSLKSNVRLYQDLRRHAIYSVVTYLEYLSNEERYI